jgi:hypothetical protein
MNFRAKAKKKHNLNTFSVMSDADYNKLCLDVTRRIVDNNSDAKKEDGKIFSFSSTDQF